jgi:hypothetical protein
VAGEPRRVMEPAVEAGGGEDGIAQPRRPCRARVVPGDPAAAARVSATAAGEEVMGLPPLAWERAARSQDAPGRVQRGLQLGLERLDHRLPGRAGAGQAPRAGREGPGRPSRPPRTPMGDKFSPGRATARRSLHPSWGLMGPLRALATSWQNGGRVSKACHDGGLSTLPSKSTVPVHVSTSSPIHLQMITNTSVMAVGVWPLTHNHKI